MDTPAGAPAPLQLVPNQPVAPTRSAVAQASDAARAAIASGAPLVPGAPPAGQPAPAPAASAPAVPVSPVAPKPTDALPAPKAPVAAPPAGETPEQRTAREAAEAAAAAGAATETPEQIAAREAEEAKRIELPVGETDDDHIVLSIDDPAMAEQVRGFVEEAVAGRAAVAELESARATVQQTEDLREYADADPIGFTLDMIGTDLNAAKALTMYLLTQPSLYAAVKDDLAKLADPKEFRILAGDARDARHTMTDQANERIETSRVVRQNLQDVQTTVNAMLPENLTPQQRQVAYRDCLRDLKDFADSKELVVLPVHQIPAVLANRLSALGIDPEEAAARATVAAARKGGLPLTPRTAARAAVPTRTPPARPVAPAPKNGAAFVASATRKREAGAIPTAGAGSPNNPGGLQAPRDKDGKPLGIKDTIQWAKEQRAKGVHFF